MPLSTHGSPSRAQALGALSPAEELTPLGRHLTLMPLDPRVGKMLVFGALLRCASPVLTVAAAMGHGRQIFFSPADKRQKSQVTCLLHLQSHTALDRVFCEERLARPYHGLT